MALVEEVFRLSGLPTHTFVEPVRYDEIKISIRTPGRSSVIEGPSGIGKTTTVTKAIEVLKLQDRVNSLSARRPVDAELIAELPAMQDIGTVTVDDFHRLPDAVKGRLSDYMKVLADSGSDRSKLILIGINKTGQQLVKFAHDLGMRIDVFKLEANPKEKIEELIGLGERALNVEVVAKEQVARQAQGSFQIAQVLCHKLCVLSKITETCPNLGTLDLPHRGDAEPPSGEEFGAALTASVEWTALNDCGEP
jgi:hypothetical protein